MSLGIVLFIVAILVVVMVHEAGHFFVAKLFGFKATKFFVGFGPKVWSVKKGETEYGIAAIPAGGFVKIVGMNPYEDVAPEDEARSYPNKPRWQRALLLVAGSATHWVVAFVVLLVTTMTIGFPTGDASTEVSEIQTRIEGQTSPAVEAGLEPGDRIVAVDGVATPVWDDVTREIREHPGETITIAVERDGERLDLEADLWAAVFDVERGPVAFAESPDDLRAPGATEEVGGFLGFTPAPEMETKGLFGGIVDSGKRVGELTVLSVKGIGQVFGMVFGGELWDALTGEGEREVDEGPLGLVGASRIAGESVQRGELLNFIGLIVGFTVFVGLMNLLPLPPLDGGHLAVLLYEKVTGRVVDIRKLIPVAAAVISFFVVLFIAVLYLDLARPVKVPF